MGQQARQRIWQSKGTSGNERMVLLALADTTPDDRYTCYPSISTIAEMAGISDRQVQRIIQALVGSGHIVAVFGRGRNHTTRYAILEGLSEGEQESAHRELGNPTKGDIAMSPFNPSDHEKGDRKGDIKHDIAMSPFTADSEEKVTFSIGKGDIAMSPEQKEQNIYDSSLASDDAATPQGDEGDTSTNPPNRNPHGRKMPPAAPAAIRQIMADMCQIDVEGGTAGKGQVIDLNKQAGRAWKAAQAQGKSEAECVEAIRYVAGWIKKTVYPYTNGQPLKPSVILDRWRAAMEARPKPPVYSNGAHTNGTHPPDDDSQYLSREQLRALRRGES